MNFRLFFVCMALIWQGVASCPAEEAPQQHTKPVLDPTPYLLPKKHRLRPILDKIFSTPKVIEDVATFGAAGFTTLYIRPKGLLRVASHPAVKGYLFKLFLETEATEDKFVRQQKLIQRCQGAAAIRRVIKKKKLRYITVPNKWLYEIPASAQAQGRTFILIAQDMQLTDRLQSRAGWKTKVTRKHLRELYCILKKGYASLGLAQNIPYTKNKTFSCIDTEYAPRHFQLQHVKPYLSPKMRLYWDKIAKLKPPTLNP